MDFLFLLLIKHAIVDLGMQTHLVDINKSKYLGNGHIHYMQHGIGTIVIAGLFLPAASVFLCVLVDYVLHWHIDFSKHRINRFFNIEARTAKWWWGNTIDQCLHFTTYYWIVVYFSEKSLLTCLEYILHSFRLLFQ